MPAYGEALIAAAEQEPRLVALDADLRLDTGLVGFRERFPDRFFECGIAEQDMVSQAGSMALAGLIPVCHSFACFLSTRPNEQIYNNATERSKVIYVGSLAGPRPRRARPLAPVGARHLRARRDARDGADRAVLGARGARRRELGRPPRARLGLPPPGQRALGARLRAARGRGAVTGTRDSAAARRRDPVRGRRAGDGRGRLACGRGARRRRGRGRPRRAARGCATWTAPGWPRSRTARTVVTLDNHYVTGGQGDAVLAALRGARRRRTACTRSVSPASRSRAATTRC